MNALRMIKLFAWESKVEAQIAEKREGEAWDFSAKGYY